MHTLSLFFSLSHTHTRVHTRTRARTHVHYHTYILSLTQTHNHSYTRTKTHFHKHTHGWRLLLSLLIKKKCSSFVWNSQGAVLYSHRSEWEPFQSAFQTETETGDVPVTLNVWHLWRSQNVTILNLWPRSHHILVTNVTNGQIKMWVVQPCFCLCFDWNGSEWTKYGKTHQKVSSVSVFSLESGSELLKVWREICYI